MLQIVDHLTPEIYRVTARELHRILPQPTLVHLAGARNPPLFVSVLLHGNEDSGLAAVQELLGRFSGKKLPRALSIFFGNVLAAKEGVRRLSDQPDFNRIWRAGTTPEHLMVHQVMEHMRQRQVFASVDIHNNTGVNPHYACINKIDHRFLHLATLFGRTVVYFVRPQGVQTAAFAELCPAVVLECGKVGERAGILHAANFLEACLHLGEIPSHPLAPRDIDLYHTVATVRVPDYCSLAFGKGEADIVLKDTLDQLNFTELPAGTPLGKLRWGTEARLVVSDEAGRDVSDQFFDYSSGEIRTLLPVMPSMFTLNQQVIRQDCLGYLMERIHL